MAPKQGPQGMSNWVHSKDPGDVKRRSGANSRTGQHDDLKVGVPRNGQAANSRQTRSQAPHGAQQQVQGDQTQGRRQSDRQKPFYGTDAGSIGDTSETPSTLHVQAHQPPAVHDQGYYTEVETAEPSSEGQYTEGGSENQDEYGDDEDDLPDNPLDGRLNDKQIQLMKDFEASKANSKTGHSLPYVKGDSYPSTTSGPPSVYQTDGRRAVHTEQKHAATAVPLPTRGHGQRQPFAPQHAQNQHQVQPQRNQPQQPQRQNVSANGQFKRPDAPDQSMLQQQATEGFSFTAPKANASAKVPTNNQRQGESVVNRPREPARANVPQQPSMPVAERANGQPAPTIPTKAERKPAPQVQACTDDSYKATRHTISKPQQAVNKVVQPPQPQPAQDDGDLSDHEHEEHKIPVPEELPVDLDYDEAELYDMDFASLKSLPFDSAPRDEPLSFPGVATDDTIDKQVAVVADFHPTDQHKFLTALPIDEWEQAGDWFLGKFGETLGKLKNLRQEKRKAARAFEKEVEARHVAVTKKRSLTEAALTDMRTSGSMVLEGTPKKAKKTK